MTNKKLLLGLHYKDEAEVKACMAKRFRYDVVAAEDIDEFMAELRTHNYSRVYMDINPQINNSPDISPAERAWEEVKPFVDRGLVKFLATSAAERVVEKARKKGIPVQLKGNIDFEGFLKD